MKAKLNFKSKRTIIIIAIIAVIAIAAAVAGYYFIKGNNTAGATNAGEQTSESSNSEALETPSTSAQSGNNGVDATNPEQNQEQGTDVANNDGDGEQTTGDVTETTENGETGTTTENAGTTTGTQGGTTAGTGTGTTAQGGTTGTTTDNTETDATTTYEQVEENIVVEEPWETHMVEWTPETFNVSTASVELSKRNLLVEKTATTSTGYSLVSPGEKITYTIKVTNNEETTLNSLYISDVIPTGTIFESVDERGTTITDGNNNVTRVVWNLWNLGLKQNESIEVSFVVKVAENAKGTITNIALAEGEESTSTNNSVLESSKTSIITRGKENKVVAEPARANDEITYTISVKNTGDVAGNTLIKDSDLVEKVLNDEKATLVGEIKVYEEKDGTETEKETITLDTLTKNGYEVNIAEKSTIKVVYTIKLNKISGKVINKATIGETDTNTDEVETIGIDVEKEVTDILRTENDKLDSVGKDAPAKVGDLIQYKIVVTNVGSTKLVDVKVEDKLEGVEIISGNLNIGELEAGASVELTAEYQVTSEKDIIGKIDRKIVNVVKVTGTEEQKDPEKETEKVTDTDEAETPVEEVKELVVEKTATKVNDEKVVPVKESDVITYEIKVTNKGNVTLNNIVVNESLDVEGSLEIGTLAPGEDKTIEVTYKVKDTDVNDKTTLENVVTATGETTDGEKTTSEEDKEHVEVEEVKELVVEKTATKVNDGEVVPVKESDVITYEIKVTNKGNVTLNNIVVNESLEVVGSLEIGTLAPGENKTIEVTYKVKDIDVNDKTTLENVVTATGETTDGEKTTSEEDKEPVEVEEVKELVVEKTATKVNDGEVVPVKENDVITYEIKVTNTGNVTLNNIVVNESLDVEGSLEIGTLAPGEDKTIEVTYKVKDTDVNDKTTLENVVTATGETTDGEKTTSEEEKEPVEVEEVKELVVEKTATKVNDEKVVPVKENDVITYEIKVTNKGNVTLNNIVVNESLDVEGSLEIGTLAPGEDKTIEVTYKVKDTDVNDKTTLENVVTATGETTDGEKTTSEEDKEPVEVEEVKELVVEKTATKVNDGEVVPVKANDVITYEIKVTNTGNVTLNNIVVNESLDVEGSLEIGTLAPGEDKTIEVTYKVKDTDVNDETTLENVVTATGETTDGEKTTSEEDKEPVDIEKVLDLEVEKTVSIDNKNFKESVSVGNGDTAYFKIYVKNNSNVSLKITAEDTLELTKTDATKSTEKISKLYTDKEYKTEFNGTTLAPDGELTIYASKVIEQTIVNDVNKMVNTIAIHGEEANPEEGETPKTIDDSDTAEVEVKKPEITSTKISYVNDSEGNKVKESSDTTPMKVEPGEIITYEIEITNNGGTTGNTEIKDYLPSEVEMQGNATIVGSGNAKSVTAVPSTEEKDGKEVKLVTINVTELSNEANKNTIKVLINAKVKDITDDQAKLGVEVKNSIYADGNTAPTDTTTDVVSKPAISATKSSICDTAEVVTEKDETTGEEKTINKVHPGDEITYTMEVTNSGLIESKELDIEDVLPAGVTIKKDADGKNEITAEVWTLETEDVQASKVRDIAESEIAVTPAETEDGKDTIKVAINDIKIAAKQKVILTIVVKVDNLGEGTYTANIKKNRVDVKTEGTTIPGEDPKDYEVVEPTKIVTITKQWDDNNDELGLRKDIESITIMVYNDKNTNKNLDDGEAVASTTIVGNKEDKTWSIQLTLPKYDENENEITYRVKETNIPEGYNATYSEDGLTITNELQDPEIEVKKQLAPNQETEIQYNDTITYNIIAENKGNVPGKVTIKDEIPNNSVETGSVKVTIINTETGKTISTETLNDGFTKLSNGYEINLEKDQKATITFSVKADGYAGNLISNTAKYKIGDDDKYKDTETINTKIEDTTKIIPTTTSLQSTPQKAILVLDVSGSMNDEIVVGTTTETKTRWVWKNGKMVEEEYEVEVEVKKSKLEVMKEAVELFLEDFLKNKNEVMIVTYSGSAKVACNYTSDAEKAYNSIGSADGGTNIDAGLTVAYNNIKEADALYTSVILMTDGIPGYHRDNKTQEDKRDADKNGNSGVTYNGTAANEAKESAGWIKDLGSKLYTIGFGLDSISNSTDRTKVEKLMEDMATDATEDTEYYYNTFNADDLKKAFSDIQTSITTNMDPIPLDTIDGIVTISEGFAENQKIEIYLGEYKAGESKPYKAYTWDEFFKLTYKVEEDGKEVEKTYATKNEDNTEIKFNLGKYMEDNKIDKAEDITIRFVK